MLPRDKAIFVICFYKVYFRKEQIPPSETLLQELLVFPYIFTNMVNDTKVISHLPQHEVSTKNVDMGQRNQIRGQREREKNKLLPDVRMILKINCKLGSGYTLSLLFVS